MAAAGSFYEFFAGADLGTHWRCLFTSDFDRKKAATYNRNCKDSLLYYDVRSRCV